MIKIIDYWLIRFVMTFVRLNGSRPYPQFHTGGAAMIATLFLMMNISVPVLLFLQPGLVEQIKYWQTMILAVSIFFTIDYYIRRVIRKYLEVNGIKEPKNAFYVLFAYVCFSILSFTFSLLIH